MKPRAIEGPSITARVREAIEAGFSGTAKDLAAKLDVDVRRIYSAKHALSRSTRAGTRSTQPSKRRVHFSGEVPEELRKMRERARRYPCSTCKRIGPCVALGLPGETFSWGVHIERARAAGCPDIPPVSELNKGAGAHLFDCVDATPH